MSYTKAGGKGSLSLSGKTRGQWGRGIPRIRQTRPPEHRDFPRIPREVIEKLLNENKKGGCVK